MRFLIDTNVLGRLAQPRHAFQVVATKALDKLAEEGNELRIVPQVVYEFWSIATRPASENGLGFSVDDTKEQLRRYKLLFPPLRDERGILEPWEKLVVDFSVAGKTSHDARLVAAMHRHGLTHILTFNPDDFQRYPGIQVMTPQEVVSS
jgi:predicted nucleic acid-binding protein